MEKRRLILARFLHDISEQNQISPKKDKINKFLKGLMMTWWNAFIVSRTKKNRRKVEALLSTVPKSLPVVALIAQRYI